MAYTPPEVEPPVNVTPIDPIDPEGQVDDPPADGGVAGASGAEEDADAGT